MSDPQAQINVESHRPSLLAGFLSYLVPGLGQISQGRVGKGLMFMFGLLGMFIGGQALGDWHNVFLPNKKDIDNINPFIKDVNPWHLPGPVACCISYPRWHYGAQFWMGVAAWPAIWQYYQMPMPSKEQNPFWHNFQKAPENEYEVNTYLRNSDKTPELAWVYTVIAGMLNILVIYDAYAGPVHSGGKEPSPGS
jgi:hypothetical protein